MSGQYPPPNPAHPYSRVPHHQRAPPSQRVMPPWGHSPQPGTESSPALPKPFGMNVMGGPMNFYSSPHVGLPSRGSQPWVPQQTHPKPSDSRPGSTNPLFGLQMLMSPEGSQRIPTEYEQEETMDLSSHSNVPSLPQDPPKIVSTRSETNDLLRNGAILPPEVNGDVNRTSLTEAEVKDSIVTSVIASNPLREIVTGALNCTKVAENSVLKRVEVTTIPETVVSNPSPSCAKSESDVDVTPSEPVNSLVSSVLKTTTSSIKHVQSESVESDRLGDTLINELEEKSLSVEENLQNLFVSNKSVDESNSCLPSAGSPKLNESQISHLNSSALSVDTDESKLVVAESSADDIFGISPVGPIALTSQEVDKPKEVNESPPTTTEAVPVTKLEAEEALFSSTPAADPPPAPPLSVVDPEPHPSVENVETLLESMFNSQEETSCSSQTSNSGVPQSVIVSSGARAPAEGSRPPADIITPMKEEELAMTLAEDNPVVAEIQQEEKEEEKITSDMIDEIEKNLELLTESKISTSEPSKFDGQVKAESPITEPVKEEPDISKNLEEKNEAEPDPLQDDSEIQGEKPVASDETVIVPEPKAEPSSSCNPFIEVETQLEKMFAGIVEPTDEMTSDNASQPSASEPKKPIANKRTIAKRKKANSRRASDTSVFGGSSGESTPVKKKGRKRMNDSGSEKGIGKKMKIENQEHFIKKGRASKEVANDLNSKAKGPFVHIEGSKESPASVVVVNSGVRADDEDGVDKISARRKHSTVRTEGVVRKAGSGYSSSTLSMRYNSDTTDLSWVCVFCKRGPHCAGGLGGEPAGDLFGPYRIPVSPSSDEAMPSGTPADRDVVDEQKKRGGKYPKSLRTSGGAEHFIQKMAKKNKRSGSSDSVESQPGLLFVDGCYEVWLHGPCAEWAPGLCIIGTQLVGLEDAVWTALRTRCTHCGETGAGLGCVVRNCSSRMHYHCAVLSDWLLDADTFIARCHVHRTRLRPL